MGRLPDQYAGRKITQRTPYSMPGEILIVSGEPGKQFPDATFTFNVDKPFEVHRVKPWAVALDSNGDVLENQPPQEALQSLLRFQLNDLGKTEKMTKNPQLLALLPKGTAEATWEWAEPYTIVRSEGFQVVVDALAYTNFDDLATIRLAWKFEGFLLVIAPPSESR